MRILANMSKGPGSLNAAEMVFLVHASALCPPKSDLETSQSLEVKSEPNPWSDQGFLPLPACQELWHARRMALG